jgi:hypothetical protein
MRTAGLTRPDDRGSSIVRAGGRLLISIAVSILTASCGRDGSAPANATGLVGWRTLGTWAGTANLQTETFTSDTGSFRVHWQAKPEAAPTGGSLHVIFRSADSGNPIIDAVNHRGAGDGIASVSAERPRWYYLTIESSDIAWTIRVEEPIFGQGATHAR